MALTRAMPAPPRHAPNHRAEFGYDDPTGSSHRHDLTPLPVLPVLQRLATQRVADLDAFVFCKFGRVGPVRPNFFNIGWRRDGTVAVSNSLRAIREDDGGLPKRIAMSKPSATEISELVARNKPPTRVLGSAPELAREGSEHRRPAKNATQNSRWSLLRATNSEISSPMVLTSRCALATRHHPPLLPASC